MNCHHATARFSDLRDGRLRAGELAELKGHLAICPACRQEWTHFQEAIEMLQDLTPVEPSPGFAARVRAQIDTAPWYRRLARWLFIPWRVKLPLEAAALVLVAVGTVFIYQRSPEMRQAVERPAMPPVPTRVEPERRGAAPDLMPALKGARKGKPRQQAGRLMGGVSGPRADEVAPQAGADLDKSAAAGSRTQPSPEKLPSAAPSPPPAAPREAEETARSLSLLRLGPTLQPFRIMTLRTRDVAIAEERIREWVQQAGGRLLDPPAGGEPIAVGQRTLSLVVPARAVSRLDALLAELGQLFGKELEVPPSNEAMISLTILPKPPLPAKSE